MSMSQDRHNPFAPPKAAVLQAASDDGLYVEDGQKVAAGRGAAWWSEAWALFRQAPGMWILIFVVFMVLSFMFAVVPLGSLVSNVCYPVIVAGLMLGCKSIEEGNGLEFGHLFAGFKKNVGNLLLVGVLYLVGMLLIVMFVGIGAALLIPAFVAGGGKTSPDFMVLLPIFLLVVLVVLALMLPLIMALWFAPALVVFHDVQPLAAMKASMRGSLRNFVPFLVYGVVGLGLAIVALIPLGLGFLVYAPLLWATIYTGYRDIYIKHD